MFTKSLSLETFFTDVPLYERFALARAAGFRHVELDGWTELVFSRVTEELRRHGLQLTCISGSRGNSLRETAYHEDFLEYLSQTIAVAKCLSSSAIVISSEQDVADSVLPGEDAGGGCSLLTSIIRTLREAARMAAKAGVTLLMQTSAKTLPKGLPSCTSGPGDVVKLVNSPALRLMWVVQWGAGVDEEERLLLRQNSDIIGYVQVEDGGTPERTAFKADFLSRSLNYDGIIGFRCHRS